MRHRFLIPAFLMLGLVAGSSAALGQSWEAIPATVVASPAVPMVLTSTLSSRQAPENSSVRTWKRVYTWSTVAAGAGVAADLASSFQFSANGQREANALLRTSSGQFGTKGALLEAGAFGAVLLMERLVIRHHPGTRLPFALANFGLAGFQAWNVRHNVSY